MVWGMVSWYSLGSLIVVEGTMNQYKHTSIVAGHVEPYMRIVFSQDDSSYQQDNAKWHTVYAWFEKHLDELTSLPWPANSPDLNLIENLWDYLNQVVHAIYYHPRNLVQLEKALESAWLNTSQ